MSDHKDEGARVTSNDALAQSIVKQAGITEDQARAYRLIGTDRNSLLREARQLLLQRLR